MSYALDVNVLLYASNTACPEHAPASASLQRCAREGEVLCLTWPTLMAYLRMSTHPSIFPSPLTPDQAAQNVEELIGLPNVRMLAELEGFWGVYRQVCGATLPRGNRVPDTHLAALLKQHGVGTLYTNDADFR